MKGVDTFTVTSKRYAVTFMRIGNSIAWYTKLKGKIYGDYITEKPNFYNKVKNTKQTIEMLCAQAINTLIMLEKNIEKITKNELDKIHEIESVFKKQIDGFFNKE